MTKPLQDRDSISIDEIKELESWVAASLSENLTYVGYAEKEDSVPPETVRDFEWIITTLYLSAYQRGYINGRGDGATQALYPGQ